MRCKFCETENDASASFCIECGAQMKRFCTGCRTELAENAKFCPKCGKRCDGKTVCTHCGALMEDTAAFCTACGQPLTTVAAVKVRSKPTTNAQPEDRSFVMKALDYARAGLVTALAMAIFILSFFGVFKMDIAKYLELDNNNLTVRVTSIDIIEGAFACINPMTEKEMKADFERFAKKYGAIRTPDDIIRVVNKYNPLKLAFTKEALEINPTIGLTMTFLAIGAFGVIFCTGAFMIVSIISLIFLVTGRRKLVKSTNIMMLVATFVAVGLIALSGLLMEGSSVGGSMIALITLGLTALIPSALYAFAERKFALQTRMLPSLVSGGVHAILNTVLLCLAVAAVVTITCEMGSDFFRYGYNAAALSDAWSYKTAADAAAENLYGTANAYFAELGNAVAKLPDWMIAQSLSPAMMGVLGTKIGYEVGMIVLGILTEVFAVVLIALLCVSFVMTLKGLVTGRSSGRTIFAGAAFFISVVTLILSCIYAFMVTNTLSTTKDVAYEAHVAAPLIVLVVFAGVNLAQNIACKVVRRHLTKKSVETINAVSEM